MASRSSTRLRAEDPEEDGRPYACFICLVQITINLVQVMVTPCCNRRIHRHCLQVHRNTSNQCGHCREPFPAREEPDNPIQNDDLTSHGP